MDLDDGADNVLGENLYLMQSNCDGSGATCEYFADVLNWVLVEASATFGTSVTITTAGDIFDMPPYEDQWDYTIKIIKDNLIAKEYTKSI